MEVSAGMSVFLSCVLIKVCLYGLIRTFLLLGGEGVIFPLLLFLGVGVFDITLRLSIQSDLKAITAYGSVLHVNLLAFIFLLDSNILSPGFIYYIWGHSYATAGVFYAINLIERCFSSRSTFELSGIYHANPAVALVALAAVVTFLEFPLGFFFWGELWLWLLILDTFPIFGGLLMLFCVFLYMLVYFRI